MRDEALLEQVVASGETLERWWIASSPAVVLGLGLRHRRDQLVDAQRCAAAGVEVLERRAGGGVLLLDDQMLCGAVCVPLPNPAVADDLTESYRWLGDWLAQAVGGRRVHVDEARADVSTLRSAATPLATLLLSTCYGALSPHEVVFDAAQAAKVVGLAQVRRRHAALFQIGILLRDQSPLADYLLVPDERTRVCLRAELARRTVGVTGQAASAVAAAVADARPSAP